MGLSTPQDLSKYTLPTSLVGLTVSTCLVGLTSPTKLVEQHVDLLQYNTIDKRPRTFGLRQKLRVGAHLPGRPLRLSIELKIVEILLNVPNDCEALNLLNQETNEDKFYSFRSKTIFRKYTLTLLGGVHLNYRNSSKCALDRGC